MHDLRAKSSALTSYLNDLLLGTWTGPLPVPYQIITPHDPRRRGAQLSIQLAPGLCDVVVEEWKRNGVVVDGEGARHDVIRVAPTPLYNNFTEV